ncbi:WD40 repeat protein [Dokdonia sp. Hel_I_63]|uniref:OmpA family protein n=1 Tax=unclassified Dokdonia TaxID=2615033 RepID=UPI00020A7320|nr:MULTISPECIES: OmpA family protein [unclassified Dokdonia]AEE19742.1 OmpA/MotB domain protein [Dokdonia sp. 4H-3-7-5]TVZ24040.1 WD40 repeat protein [Dokdonia sp. Hel_I_63]
MTKNITILLLLFSVSLFAQKTYKNADKLFEQMRYVEAAAVYEKAIDRGDNFMVLLQKAGDSYYFNTNMEEAYKWYDLLVSQYRDEVDAEYLFRFAHSLQGIGDYKAAKKWMKAFAKASTKNDKRIDDYAQKERTLADVLAIPAQFELKNLSINTAYSDFGPAYYGNKLVYSSAVDTSYYIKRRYHWNDQPFLDFYIGQINAAENEVKREKIFSKIINTKYHEATIAFTNDGNRIYFTRNNYDGDLKRGEDGISHLKLYTAVRNDSLDRKDDWSDVRELPFNSKDYSTGHPTLSEDGSKLYFVSDMPGTIGATDIFVVDILGDNTYSTPRNLGPKVNTSGREMFPFIAKGVMYFASDGHLGVGGLDVFESNMDNDLFSDPRNLGKPLNSKLDDFGFIINEEGEQGFVCSNREGGVGDDDIYAIQRIAPEDVVNDCKQLVKGYVINARTQERIADATVSLFGENGVKLSETVSKRNGDYVFNFDLDCAEQYDIKVNKLGYTPNSKNIVTSSISSETVVPLDLETLSELIVEDGGLLKIKVGIIFFDLNKDYIRPDAAMELNKIVTLLSQQPSIEIRIESHTDARADDNYNMELSQRRAISTKNYLIRQGIAKERILSAQGFGETQLLNDCSNGVQCDEVQHQINRRSEFIIEKM